MTDISRPRRAAAVALCAATFTAVTAGAATLHRLSLSQTGGSGGAQTVLQNTAAGSALQGEVGGSSANTTIKIPFGVLGEYDPPNPQFGAGVLGISATGYAVAGETFGNQPSVLGYAGGSGYGVEGVTPSRSQATAVLGLAAGTGYGGAFSSQGNIGLLVTSVDSDAIYAQTPGNGGTATIADPYGSGVIAYGYSGNSTPALSAVDREGGSDLFAASACAADAQNFCTNPESFIVQSASANRSGDTAAYKGAADVQISGDVYVLGRVYENCLGFPVKSTTDCTDSVYGGGYGTSAITRSAGGSDVKMYGSAQSVRTVEDFGQAQLVNGRAYVRLDPAFARTTAPAAPYLVLVTPEGDSRGVFTANHTVAGFDVRENGGGRSTLTIDYRIVAKPLGDASQRFVAVTRKAPIPPYDAVAHPRARGYKMPMPKVAGDAPVPPVALAHR